MGEQARLRTAKHIPNALSAARIPLSLSLLAVRPFSPAFVAIYIACGLTDALDGFLARRLHAGSPLGARLDSIADLIFFAVALYIFLSAVSIPSVVVTWALAVIAVRMCALALACMKFRSWAALHTHAFKVAGFAFFCFPVLVPAVGTALAAIIPCALATAATCEECYINLRSSSLDPDIQGAWQLDRA